VVSTIFVESLVGGGEGFFVCQLLLNGKFSFQDDFPRHSHSTYPATRLSEPRTPAVYRPPLYRSIPWKSPIHPIH